MRDTLWWLSFADDSLPDGQRCWVVVAEGATDDDVVSLAEECWERGCNPGGEVLAVKIPEDTIAERKLPRWTPLSEADLRNAGLKLRRIDGTKL